MSKFEESPQMKIRLSQALKSLIEQAAKSNNRTMNAEIVNRLEGSFNGLNFQLNGSINELSRSIGLTEAQRQEVLEIVRTELECRAK